MASIIQFWLTQFDCGKLDGKEVEASVSAEDEAQVAVPERRIAELMIDMNFVKKHRVIRLSAPP
ncbi:hypothetical protein [Mesorhizobium sp. DCY119]|uniref:hypothetical protein n=1 Tax=Mesorhizobium sp. DCY119 TaxID=2108445 RepID=UPI001058607A|nr:hypothetical protein [Mesorhizobium sp. DCY119]